MQSKVLVGPSGDRLIVHTGAEESSGALFRFELVTRTSTPPPADHVHGQQEERVEVLAGTLHCRLAGRVRVLSVGAALTIPPGMPHAVWKGDEGETRTIGEFRPALGTQRMFEAWFAEG
jgi:quercetin dioxygenase-like cupin family protein